MPKKNQHLDHAKTTQHQINFANNSGYMYFWSTQIKKNFLIK